MNVKTVFYIFLLLGLQLDAKSYSMCASSYADAKLELASMVNTTVDAVQSKHIESKKSNGDESVSSTIEQITSVESHLELVDIDLYVEGNKRCAKIRRVDQVHHTMALLAKTKRFSIKNLPIANEKKVAMLEQWLSLMTTTEQMLSVFGDDVSSVDRSALSKKYKIFNDLHTETLLQIEALVFKGCAKSKEKSLSALDQTIFTHATYEKKSFIDSMTSWLSFEESKSLQVMLFEPYIATRVKGAETCTYIIKSELLLIAEKMRYKLEGFKLTTLSKDPKKRLKQLDNWIEHINVTYRLMQVFKSKFTRSQLQSVEIQRATLIAERKKIIPQSIVFHISGTTTAKIVINSREIKANKQVYFPVGSYNYRITAKGFCPIEGSMTLDTLEDEVVSIDFEGHEYPTILFVSDIDFTAMVDGISIQPNVRKSIERCSQEVPYLVKANKQSYQDTLDLDPGDVITKNFSFLDVAEMAIFTDSTTKHFSVKNDEKISDTLSALSSKKLVFKVLNAPKKGVLRVDKSGHFIYTPQEEFIGKVNFDYVIKNAGETSPTKVAIIEITGIVKPKNVKKEPEKEKKQKENPTKVDEEKLDAFLTQKLKENDIATLKQAQKRFPEAFGRWMKKTRGQ